MELLLVRHSTTKANEESRYSGSNDIPLTKAGIEKAMNAIPFMPKIDRLFTSPMLRSVQTAKIMFEGMRQTRIADIREMDFGEFEGKTYEDLKDNPDYRRFISWESDTVPGGEHRDKFNGRVSKGLTEIISASEGVQRAGAVTHGGVIMAVMAQHCLPKRQIYHWQLGNCEALLVKVDSVQPLVLRLIEHIKPE